MVKRGEPVGSCMDSSRVPDEEVPAYFGEVLLAGYSRKKGTVHDWLHQGRFGNKLRTWRTYSEILEDVAADRFDGLVTMRTTLGGGGPTEYNLPIQFIPAFQRLWKETKNISPDLIRFNENAPDDRLLIQGYVKRTEAGLEFWHSFLKTKMNTALKKAGKRAYCLEAHMLLKEFLNGPSYDDLEELLDAFPDRVVELSCYEMDVGNIPNRNTVFWEARDY